jgi:desulfoferrodoxin-like iron-binding protein
MAATKVGTRLRCERCGTEIIVVKATDDDLACCGQPMVEREG